MKKPPRGLADAVASLGLPTRQHLGIGRFGCQSLAVGRKLTPHDSADAESRREATRFVTRECLENASAAFDLPSDVVLVAERLEDGGPLKSASKIAWIGGVTARHLPTARLGIGFWLGANQVRTFTEKSS